MRHRRGSPFSLSIAARSVAKRALLEDRELSGISDRHLRPGAYGARISSSSEIRCSICGAGLGRRTRLLAATVAPRGTRQWRFILWADGCDRGGRALPSANERNTYSLAANQ